MTDTPEALSSRDRLIAAAERLFRRQGYHATGLAEILAEAQLPKGSLYHHFPNGKADLARAAADLTAAQVSRIMRDAFAAATDWQAGAATLFHKLAKLFDLLDSANACPISALMFDGPEEESFRDHAGAAFQRIIATAADEGQRLGLPASLAMERAETLMMAVQGAWTLARMRRDSDVLRQMPARLYPPGA